MIAVLYPLVLLFLAKGETYTAEVFEECTRIHRQFDFSVDFFFRKAKGIHTCFLVRSTAVNQYDTAVKNL